MKWDTNIIIAIGLVVMGNIAVVGWIGLSLQTGTSTGTEIPIGIISGLTGVLTGKKLAEYELSQKQPPKQSQTAQAFEQVASHGQQIVNAIDGIKDTLKK